MYACKCSNESFNESESYGMESSGFEMESSGFEKESMSHSCEISMESKCSEKPECGRGPVGCPNPCKPPKGRVRKFDKHFSINGKEFSVINKNFYNNYYSRYNHIHVTDVNYIKDFVRDYNIYHYHTRTIYCGCKYLGATTLMAKDGCGKMHKHCC